MAPMPFMLVAESTVAAVHLAAAAALRSWAAAWGVAPSALALACTRGAPGEPDRAAWRQCWGERERRVWHAPDTGLQAAIQHALFAPDDGGPGAGLAQAGAARALEDLLAAMTAALLPADDPAPAALPEMAEPAQFARGAGSVTVRVAVGDRAASFLLNFSAAAQLGLGERAAGGAATATPPLPAVDFLHALRSVAVALRVEIGRAEVELGALLSVGVGDIIRLGTGIDAPIAVRGPDGAAWFDAYLGRIHDTVAIEITSRT